MELSEEIRKNPFIRIVIPFILGIIVSINFYVPVKISLLLFLLLIIAFVIFHFIRKFSYLTFTGILINLILLLFGLFITQYTIDNSKKTNLISSDGFVIGEVEQDVKRTEKTVKINLNVLAIKHNDEWITSSGKTLLYIQRDSLSEMLKSGDRITFSPDFSEIQNKGNPEEFDYKKYLSYSLIYSSDYLSSGDWRLLESENNFKLKYQILHFRTKLINKLEEFGLTDDELSVVSALSLGYKDELSNEIRHSYSSSGAMHILAVSGLHVGIVYGVLAFLLSFIRNRKFNLFKVIVTIAFIWFYAILTGLSPSVMRAAAMFTIITIGSLGKYKSSPINSIAASAFILLLINPLNIVDIGFQLSYLAVIGIVIIQPYFYNLLTLQNNLLDKIWAITSVSIAAQIATAPIAIYYFHQFSNYFLLTNYILIPVSTIAIWLCIIVFICSGFSVVASFLTEILAYVVKFMNKAATLIESLPYSVSENLYITSFQSVILYLAIIAIFVYFFVKNDYKYLFAGIASIILFSGINLYSAVKNRSQKNVIIYNIDKVTAINIIDGFDNLMLANMDMADHSKIQYATKNNWLKKGVNAEKYINLSSYNSDSNNIESGIINVDNSKVFFRDNFIGYSDLRFYVLDNNFIIPRKVNEKMEVDYLVLSNNPNIKLEEIDKIFNYKKIVIDSSNSYYVIDKWLKENSDNKYSLYNVKTEGALVIEL